MDSQNNPLNDIDPPVERPKKPWLLLLLISFILSLSPFTVGGIFAAFIGGPIMGMQATVLKILVIIGWITGLAVSIISVQDALKSERKTREVISATALGWYLFALIFQIVLFIQMYRGFVP